MAEIEILSFEFKEKKILFYLKFILKISSNHLPICHCYLSKLYVHPRCNTGLEAGMLP